MKKHRAQYPVTLMCNMLNVSKSGFYAWCTRGKSQRQKESERLLQKIVEIHHKSRGTYGSPRIQHQLRKEGLSVGRNRIARMMRQEGIFGRKRRDFRGTTRRDERDPVAPNHLEQKFVAKAPNRRWVADITYIATDEGWLYLAVILDLYSRKVVGWAVDRSMHTKLVLDALAMALMRRRSRGPGLIHHSDRGSQYTSAAFRKRLRDAGIECSMSRKGNCYDNAVAESFFATLKVECLHRSRFDTRAQAKTTTIDFIENFYNTQRIHSALGFTSPAQYESNLVALAA